MKRSLFAILLLCCAHFGNCADFINWNNGWTQYHEKTILSKDTLNGFYSVQINDSIKFEMYIDISLQGDTICELLINVRDKEGNPRVYYYFDEKATYFFNVFRDNEDQRFSIMKFEYNDDDELSTGFNTNGLGQNKLAQQAALQLFDGHQLKFLVTPNLAKYQEIKELIIPSLK